MVVPENIRERENSFNPLILSKPSICLVVFIIRVITQYSVRLRESKYTNRVCSFYGSTLGSSTAALWVRLRQHSGFLLRQHSGFESRHPSKIINGRHKRRSGRHTLVRQKKYTKNVHFTDVRKVQNAQQHTYSHLELMSATQEVLGYRITETSDTYRHKFNPF
jgi:hypothetical protein